MQSSHDYVLPSVNLEPTESLTFVVTNGGVKESTVKNHEATKTYKKMNATATDKIPMVVAIQTEQSLKNTDTDLPKEYTGFKINQTSPITVKPNVGTVIYENVSDTNIGVKPKEVMYKSINRVRNTLYEISIVHIRVRIYLYINIIYRRSFGLKCQH